MQQLRKQRLCFSESFDKWMDVNEAMGAGLGRARDDGGQDGDFFVRVLSVLRAHPSLVPLRICGIKSDACHVAAC